MNAMARIGFDCAIPANKKRDQFVGSEKDRSILKSRIKENVSDQKHAASPTTITKGKGSCALFSGSDVAHPGSLWTQMEPIFPSLTQHDQGFVKQMVRKIEKENIERPQNFPLTQRLLSALMAEEDSMEENGIFSDGLQDDCVRYTSEDSPCGNCSQIESETENTGELELQIEPYMEMKNRNPHMLDYCNYDSHFTNEYQNHMAENSCSDDFRQDDIVVHSEISDFNAELRGSDEQYTHGEQKIQNDLQSNCQTFGSISGIAAYDIEYQDMDLDTRISLELQSIGLYPESVVYKNKCNVQKREKAVLKGKEVEEREHEVLAMNKPVESTYNRHMGLRGTNVSGGKSARNKVTEQASLDLVKRTLPKCRMFEETGKSCFSDTSLKERLFSISSKEMDKKFGGDAVKDKTANVFAKNAHAISDIKTSANCTIPSEQAAHIVDQHTQKLENGDKHLCNTIQGTASYSEKNVVKDEVRSTSVKKTQLEFEKFNASGILMGADALGATLLEGAKGKRTKRDREGKVQTKEILTKSGSNRSARPGLGNAKGEKKNKLKPRQKAAQMSAAANGLLDEPVAEQKPSFTYPCKFQH